MVLRVVLNAWGVLRQCHLNTWMVQQEILRVQTANLVPSRGREWPSKHGPCGVAESSTCGHVTTSGRHTWVQEAEGLLALQETSWADRWLNSCLHWSCSHCRSARRLENDDNSSNNNNFFISRGNWARSSKILPGKNSYHHLQEVPKSGAREAGRDWSSTLGEFCCCVSRALPLHLPPSPHLFCSAVFRIPHLLTECVLNTPLLAGRFHLDACTDGFRSIPASPTFSSTCASASPANPGVFLVIYTAEGPAR